MSELEIRNRIFEKVAPEMGDFEPENAGRRNLPSRTNPDVIVISDDQSLLFEARNQWALDLLGKVCGIALELMMPPEPIRVHHCRSGQIIDELRAGGAVVFEEH